jgi:hypothetical protein
MTMQPSTPEQPPTPRRNGFNRPKRAVAAGIVAVIALSATGVVALNARDSRIFGQDSNGVNDRAETADFFAGELAAGDFDGDGYADVAVGIPNENAGGHADTGKIQILYGSKNGTVSRGDAVFGFSNRGINGTPAANDRLGSALVVGDYNNDGFEDLAVGAPGRTVAGQSGAGAVVVLYGANKGLTGSGSSSVDQTTGGLGQAHADDAFGASLTTGDFNGDGIDDLGIGAPGDSLHAARGGAVTVLFGAATQGITETGQFLTQNDPGTGDAAEIDDLFGWSLAAADFDNDGDDDLAVGVPGESLGDDTNAGIVNVFVGGTEDPLAASLLLSDDTPGVATAVEDDDRFGGALAAGNFNNDAFGDLAVSAPGESRGRKFAAGAVHVISGSAIGLSGGAVKSITQKSSGIADAPDAGDDFGYELSVGNYNGRGADDLAIGVPGEMVSGLPGAGIAHVLFGKATGIATGNSQTWQPGVRGVPGSAQAHAGFSRGLASGDVNGDGKDDLIVGTPGDNNAGARSGGSFLVLYG